jgi:hypothetical protein
MTKTLWFRIRFATGFETFSSGTGTTLGQCKTDAILRCWETRPELPTIVSIEEENIDECV